MDEGRGKGKVSDAAGWEAVRLVVVVHVAVPTVEVQVPAVSGIVLRTTPVVAVWAAIVQWTIAVVQVPGSINTKSCHSTIGRM